MTRMAAPADGVFTLRRRGGGGAWQTVATWPPADRARAYQAFFSGVFELNAGGELQLFDGAGAVACSIRVAFNTRQADTVFTLKKNGADIHTMTVRGTR